MIRFEKVTKTYKDKKAIENIDLEIKHGEFVSIVGVSGAGKSTLLKLIFGEEKVDEGKLYIDDIDIASLEDEDIPYLRRKIGIVFQDMKLLRKKTAFENVAFAMEVAGYPKDKIAHDVARILDIVGLKDKTHNFPDEMSGGEKQRVAIARALAHKPVLLIADEPTGNLDEVNSFEILDLLQKINQLGTTVLLATHARDLVNKIQKRVITMDKGRISMEQAKGHYKL
ncbi:MAG: cell-division ABC transporter (ATP-binding protein) [Candidatus Doudnabacteria bacterium Gr01-1014_77]|jgi:cell division transport system ATP-binding protein|uniref:Cell division ATP-binding protein FtsE n=1 Tax=Candidatus Doudnabacteria bacterium Gr01-1014_77 TaxID=2017133 RepID=A0A554JDA4_9BACT|nr:MAG: cell-division ABC transporter (ATP-binding protein) [Candidatus Doudnabacteria bacterium Gr01-1014_77]